MTNRSSASRTISRAEQFLIDDEEHGKRFQAMRQRQDKNLSDMQSLKGVTTAAQIHAQQDAYTTIMAEKDSVAALYHSVMAENDRLIREEKAILQVGVVQRISQLFRPNSEEEDTAIKKIRRNFNARQETGG